MASEAEEKLQRIKTSLLARMSIAAARLEQASSGVPISPATHRGMGVLGADWQEKFTKASGYAMLTKTGPCSRRAPRT